MNCKRFMSFKEIITYYAQSTPNQIAIKEINNNKLFSYTYKGFEETLIKKEHDFILNQKRCLAVVCENSYECISTLFAAAEAHMRIILLDQNMEDTLLIESVKRIHADSLFCSDEDLFTSLSPYLTKNEEEKQNDILFFTSGTTSSNKLVVLTAKSLCQSAYNGGTLLPLYCEDVLLDILPLNHVFGFVCGLLWGLSFGSTVALSINPRYYARDIQMFNPSVISLVPLLASFLIEYNTINPSLKLVLIGAGDCKDTILQGFQQRHIRVCYGYGLTETSSGVALSIGDDPRKMTICPDDRITIAEDGEIIIEAPSCIMKGYLDDDIHTQQVLKENKFFTGDVGKIVDGLLVITGRKKEILVLANGSKIFIPEYEDKLQTLLNTNDLCLLLYNDKITLYIYTSLDEKVIYNKIDSYMRTLEKGKQIESIIIAKKPIERTPTGKIKRWLINKGI